ncbi:hypothetical protein G7Y89_g2610 [Cudoniella acicularis]|uniref:Anaphase-promoting complex subunit 2 n=1 Tax=Cudoniella acicularis TaxID=354080 RepID=A0A8H4RUW8_9HELO|nr:hypothetical protein G7Y89_g2610 [Cudoniella acicularis]
MRPKQKGVSHRDLRPAVDSSRPSPRCELQGFQLPPTCKHTFTESVPRQSEWPTDTGDEINALYSMEAVVFEDSPLADYFEGEGGDNLSDGSSKGQGTPSKTPNPSFAPRGRPIQRPKLRQKLPPPLRIAIPQNKAVAILSKTCSKAVNSRLGRADNARFLERFRYIIVASQLLNAHSYLGQASQGKSRNVPVPALDTPQIGSLTPTGVALTASVAFTLAWLIHWTRGNRSSATGKGRIVVFLAVLGILGFLSYTYARRQMLHYLRQQTLAEISSFVAKAQEFDSAAAGALSLVQEVELVSRGYRISTPLPPVSRLDDQSQTRRCSRLRKQLRLCFADIIPRYNQAYRAIKPLTEEMDLEKYYDIYDISDTDFQEAMAGYSETEFEDTESVRVLKILAARFFMSRKIFLCCLMALDAHGDAPDFLRWGTASDELIAVATITSQAEKRLDRILSEEENFPVPPTPKMPLTPNRERWRAQLRKLNSLSSGIRGLQAKLHVLREESDKNLNETEDVSELGTTLMMQYESIGIDLKALMQEWEDGKNALASNIDRNERRVSSMSGMLSPTTSLGGLTAVEEGGTLDALKALNGEVRSRSSLDLSSSDAEEVFEAVAIPRQRSTLTREERIAKMKEDRVRRDSTKDKAEANTRMLRELESWSYLPAFSLEKLPIGSEPRDTQSQHEIPVLELRQLQSIHNPRNNLLATRLRDDFRANEPSRIRRSIYLVKWISSNWPKCHDRVPKRGHARNASSSPCLVTAIFRNQHQLLRQSLDLQVLDKDSGGPLATTHNFSEPPLSDVRDADSVRARSLSESNHVRDQVRWDRSWHLVTHALSLPAFPKSSNSPQPLKPRRDSLDGAFDEALQDVLYPDGRLPYAGHTEDIIVWHTQQVRSHFLHQVLPIILHLAKRHAPDAIIHGSVNVLETAHRQYLHGLAIIKDQIDVSAPGTSMPVLEKFRRDLHAVVSNSVMEPLSPSLRKILENYIFTVLGIPLQKHTETPTIEPEGRGSEKALRETLGLVESLKSVGLAGEKFQVTFAEIMNTAMREYVYKGCRGLWSSEGDDSLGISEGEAKESKSSGSILPRTARHSSPSRCTTDLCEWIENRYARLTVQILNRVDLKASVTWANKEKYKEMGIGHLAELRIKELFDIVGKWPNSRGALDDLRTAITTPQRRLHLTEAFAMTLKERLLHPGMSTLQILQTYISMICSFHSLDHSKVLLDRVAYPLQLYLCSREDTVRIIITGLLSDVDDIDSQLDAQRADKLIELSWILNNGSQQVDKRANDEELDWHDMDWVPDPVDAGPGYKRSKNADIIGTLIGALGSQDVFIKEFQNIIGERLLKQDGGFEREIKVLELLKVRFGEAPLQACEVMLKDIQDSGRVNAIIRRNQKLDPSEQELNAAKANPGMVDEDPPNPEGLLKPSLHAKILSRLFWPQLQDEIYQIPKDIEDLQKRYEEGFESLKASRKLTWLPALGQATVELELEDRTIIEEVHTWQATVIYAFQEDESNGTALERTVEELVESLEMEEILVRSALKFWTNKLVLHEISEDRFAVLETLNQEDRARSNAQVAASAAISNDESAEETVMLANEGITSEKMQMYWRFIQGMLKNSSSQMPLQQIAMMLKMLIAEGFPYSNEELQEFLSGKVAEGKLDLSGGKYKLKK